jgi:hypothetical protein
MAAHRDPHGRLARVLLAMRPAELVESVERPWASATFSGARHRYVLRLDSNEDDSCYSRLDEQEFDLPGHIVADIALTSHHHDNSGCRLVIEALTVVDA